MSGIERLRAIAGAWDEWGLGGTLAEIADQIERERACDADTIENIRLIVGGVIDEMEHHILGHEGMEDSPVARWARELREALGGRADEEVTDVATIRKDAYDAYEWVREHGGLDSVKRLLDWVVGHCSTKQQLDFDFWLSGRVMHELGFDEDMADRDEVERRLLARLMPEGYEWPRYEGGEFVQIGDPVSGDFLNRSFNVFSIEFRENETYLHEGFKTDYVAMVHPGERVKRPAVPAGDGEPLEVGQTVWDVESGEELKVEKLCDVGLVQLLTRDGVSRYVYPDQLTHTKPEPKRICGDCRHWQGDPSASHMGVCFNSYMERCCVDSYAAQLDYAKACEDFEERGD